MHKILSVLLFIFLCSNQVCSQILPKEGSKLNYRLIGFSFPMGSKVTACKLEIASGHFNSDDSFRKNIIRTIDSKDTIIIAEVPNFGHEYTWRTIFYSGKNNSRLTEGKFHHFSTGIIPNVDTSKMRLVIQTPAQEYKDWYIFLDGNRALYDMNGLPVWYLPNIQELVEKEGSDVRNLSLTPQGTVTFLINDERIYELNYDGDVLWRGPRNEIIDRDIHYHHEFTRLANGHYMVFGTSQEIMRHNLASLIDSGFLIVTDQADVRDSIHTAYETEPFSRLLEYDEKGNVVWSWSTAKYLAASDVYFRKPPARKKKYDVHPNSFFFDEKESVIYLGFRDISRILKIKYPGGEVLKTYGDTFALGKGELNTGLFYGQHSIRKTASGELLVYNNGTNDYKETQLNGRHTTSEVEKLREPGPGEDSLEKTWGFECAIENFESIRHKVFGYTIGGFAEELPDHSIFASMSAEYSKVFIVNKNKKVLFSAVAQKWDPEQHDWRTFTQYRASMISREDLERLIRNR